MARTVTFADFKRHLDGLGLFTMKLGLERMSAFVAAYEQRIGGALRLPVVHVVGTNGKGSTSAMLERLAREHGLKTGLYTSPHFATVRERIRIDGAMQTETFWAGLWEAVRKTAPDLELTYFELLTCMAAVAFHEQQVDVAVMEAGLGGRYDATNVFCPAVTCFTPFGLDHTAVLGETLQEIADDKADAMQPGKVAVTAFQAPEAWQALKRTASLKGVELSHAPDVCPYGSLHGWELGLDGAHQRENAQLALAGWAAFCAATGRRMSETASRRALGMAHMPGRMQHVPRGTVGGALPDIYLDGAHNIHALEALAKQLLHMHNRPRTLIFSCLKDKLDSGLAAEVKHLGFDTILVPNLTVEDRSVSPEAVVLAMGGGANAVADMESALDAVRMSGQPALICGSLYLLAEFYTLYPETLGIPDLEPINPRESA